LLERFRPRSARSADALILAALIALTTAVYSVYALRIATFQNDEELYTRLARYIAANFPSGLWQSGIYTRGLQRLDPLVLAPAFAILRGPGAYEVDHVIQCLLFAGTAVPVFLLARRAGLGRPGGHLAAVLSVVVPWAVVSTSFLSESLAYPAFAWVMYSSWVAACEPSIRREALALLAIVVAVFSRTALLAFAPLLPLAVIWQTARYESSGGVRERLRTVPAAIWRRHRLVALLASLAILAYALDALGLLPARISNALTGSYGLPQLEPISSLWARDRYYLSRIAAGTGFITLAFAIPWVATALARPRDPRSHGLAVTCLLSLVCVLLSLLQAGPDERYVLYATVPISLAFVAALRDRTGRGVLLGAVLVVLLIDSVTWPALANIYDFFTYPAAIFYSRVLINHAHLPLIHPAADRLIEGAVLVAALAWVLLNRLARVGRAATVAAALAVLGLAVVQTGYALRKYSTGPGAGAPAPERSWVDRHVPSGTSVAALAVSYGASIDYLAIWREAEFWNTSIEQTAYIRSAGYAPLPLGISPVALKINADTGLLSATEVKRPHPVPRWLLVPRVNTLTLGLQTDSAQEDPVLLLNLVHLSEPARASWALVGTSPEGFIYAHKPALLSVYPPALGRPETCASLLLVAPPAGRWPYRVAVGHREVRAGTLLAAQRVALEVPLGASRATRTIAIRLNGSVTYPGNVKGTARIENVAIGPCRSALRSGAGAGG
jgi:hypothetical protein